jgi:KH/beta-lactamase-domain protein
MANIIKEIIKELGSEQFISSASYEGANIVLYTNDRDYFLNGKDDIKRVVNIFKKRIELRAEPSIVMPATQAKAVIESLIPKEVGFYTIDFDPDRSLVIIEAEKPGLVIGKRGAILNEIKSKTMWVPVVRRSPSVRSEIIEDIRKVLFLNSSKVKQFLNKTGERVYNGWIRGRKEEWVRISFLGGASQVGRSCFLLQTPESRILIDCGVDISATNEDQYPFLGAPEFDLKEIDAVIISHAHLDHSGFIPYLYKFGYEGPVYCTPPTRDIMALLQLDLVKIMRNSGLDPLYDSEHVKNMVNHTITLDYNEVNDITPDVRITFFNAGHILGSAMVHLHIGNGLHNILYTGDFKFTRTELLDPAQAKFQRIESLIMESTYGHAKNIQPSRKEEEIKLANIIKETIKNNGKTLIPVLGVGRSQELMLIVLNLIQNKEIPEVPVYLDGMVWDITAIHSAYPEYMSKSVRNKIFTKDENPFLNPIFKRIGSHLERKKLIEEEGPCIILATSGMLTGGSSVEYLKELADNRKNSLVFVSYQGPGSLGKRIQLGEKFFVFNEAGKNKEVKIELNVFTLEGLSGHPDRKELEKFLHYLSPKPKEIMIVHGEYSREQSLKSYAERKLKSEVRIPKILDCFRLV